MSASIRPEERPISAINTVVIIGLYVQYLRSLKTSFIWLRICVQTLLKIWIQSEHRIRRNYLDMKYVFRALLTPNPYLLFHCSLCSLCLLRDLYSAANDVFQRIICDTFSPFDQIRVEWPTVRSVCRVAAVWLPVSGIHCQHRSGSDCDPPNHWKNLMDCQNTERTEH